THTMFVLDSWPEIMNVSRGTASVVTNPEQYTSFGYGGTLLCAEVATPHRPRMKPATTIFPRIILAPLTHRSGYPTQPTVTNGSGSVKTMVPGTLHIGYLRGRSFISNSFGEFPHRLDPAGTPKCQVPIKSAPWWPPRMPRVCANSSTSPWRR